MTSQTQTIAEANLEIALVFVYWIEAVKWISVYTIFCQIEPRLKNKIYFWTQVKLSFCYLLSNFF